MASPDDAHFHPGDDFSTEAEGDSLPSAPTRRPFSGPRRVSGGHPYAEDEGSLLSTNESSVPGVTVLLNTAEIVPPPTLPPAPEIDEQLLIPHLVDLPAFSRKDAKKHSECVVCFGEMTEQISGLIFCVNSLQTTLEEAGEAHSGYANASQAQMRQMLGKLATSSSSDAATAIKMKNFEEKVKEHKKTVSQLEKELRTKQNNRDTVLGAEIEVLKSANRQQKDLISANSSMMKTLENSHKTQIKDKDAQLAEKTREIKELKTKISSLEKALQAANKRSDGGSEQKKSRLDQELALAEAKSFIRMNEASNRDEAKARRKQEEEAAKSKAKSDQIAKLQSTAYSMGQTHQGFVNSAAGNNMFSMLGSGGGSLHPMGGGMLGMSGGMQGMGMNSGMHGMGIGMGMNGGMQGMGIGMGMNGGMQGMGMGFSGGMGMGMNGVGGMMNNMAFGGGMGHGLAATFNGPVGNPVSIAGGQGGGDFGSRGGAAAVIGGGTGVVCNGGGGGEGGGGASFGVGGGGGMVGIDTLNMSTATAAAGMGGGAGFGGGGAAAGMGGATPGVGCGGGAVAFGGDAAPGVGGGYDEVATFARAPVDVLNMGTATACTNTNAGTNPVAAGLTDPALMQLQEMLQDQPQDGSAFNSIQMQEQV